jgi:hypothetical protein
MAKRMVLFVCAGKDVLFMVEPSGRKTGSRDEKRIEPWTTSMIELSGRLINRAIQSAQKYTRSRARNRSLYVGHHPGEGQRQMLIVATPPVKQFDRQAGVDETSAGLYLFQIWWR